MLLEEKEFFGDEFLGLRISFGDPQSHWTLTEKLGERHSQLIPEDVIEYPSLRGAAYGTFLAKSAENVNQEAVIRIIMQIPHAGAEIASSAERARYAVQTIPKRAQDMVDALTLLDGAQCRCAPRLMGVVERAQGDTDPVPGGFLTYLLLEKLPGKKMGPWFWDLDRDERDKMRAYLKDAWIECTRTSQYRPLSSPSKMFWDASTQRMHVFDHSMMT
ncbi:hypothetical protein P170DRAFT_427840 [Aspergillus steynii IBT 23096]|uniref:Uncharacterized protein n=1 Tax=Aspergillus steynii IBT 23096 TaxID=1392250 RepID=A0A2I2G108_9EURO|nr:uncharacterized protein P170DRAFT_427840 [Aspergillus steynii IBT 23096]PLB46526.1 hypothetical protein P170DRAFT_427840 [Aspergillus steynii IBT 23096]